MGIYSDLSAKKTIGIDGYILSGNGFYASGSINLTNTNETDAVLVRNPSDSNTNISLCMWYFATNATQGIVTAKFYAQPTITSNGNSITINNCYGGSSNNSKATSFALPTISARGSQRLSMVTSALQSPPIHDFKRMLILNPGSNFLISLQVANMGVLTNITTHLFLQWVES